jgi:hypothetical protein
MTWSGERMTAFRIVPVLAALFACAGVRADDAVSFDRPGIAFGTTTLPGGVYAWEQGFPDFSSDQQAGTRTREYSFDSMLRLGMTARVELQLGLDSHHRIDMRGPDGRQRLSGGGDGSIGIKWALPSAADDAFSWAALGKASVPVGKPGIGGDADRYELGVTTAWDLGNDRQVSIYANYQYTPDDDGWELSPSYSFALAANMGAYVEAGIDTDQAQVRFAGGGMTLPIAQRMQLDAWILRGLDDANPDWQGGMGVSILFR